jgi:microcystin-dependent protein
MSDQFVAEIRMFAGNFAPTGWALCNGQLLPISQNTALFSLLGTMYGGDGKSTFALPNLQDRAPMFWGQGPGLTDRFQGEESGTETVTLIQSEIPAHAHQLRGATDDVNSLSPVGAMPGAAESVGLYRSGANSTMGASALLVQGSGQPHNNRQPYLAVTFIIALQGVFPQRS